MRTCHGGQYKSKEWVHKGVVGGINRGSMVGLGGLGVTPAGYLSPMPYIVFPNTANRGMGEYPRAFKRESWRERVGSMS